MFFDAPLFLFQYEFKIRTEIAYIFQKLKEKSEMKKQEGASEVEQKERALIAINKVN